MFVRSQLVAAAFVLAMFTFAGSVAKAAEVPLSKDNTKIGFVGTKAEGKHDGGFNTVTGAVAYDPADLTKTQISVTIDTNSLWSDDAKLTGHLKSPDFFDVRRHPTAKFVSKKVEATTEAGTYTVTGDLTLLGVTKPVTFPAKLAVKDNQFSLSSYFTIDRSEFGMTYGAGKVDNKVSITTSVQPAE